MRGRMARDLRPHGPWDTKLRTGGLIDIEFIAQTLQLCAAGRAEVLDPNTIAALRKLETGTAARPLAPSGSANGESFSGTSFPMCWDR